MSKRALLVTTAAILLLAAIFAIVLSHERLQRRRVFHTSPRIAKPQPAKVGGQMRPVEEWSGQFRGLEATGQWRDLDRLLDQIEAQHADLYRAWSLQYLHARARIENNDLDGAERKLAPYLVPGNPFRDLALFHEAEIDDARNRRDAASQQRVALIFGAPASLYRDQAIDDETAYRAALPNAKPLLDFAARLGPAASPPRKRDLEAHIVEALVRLHQPAPAMQHAVPLLRAGTMDDPADGAARAIDRPDLLRAMSPDQWVLLGETMHNHRHYDRAVALLSMALPRTPPPKRDDLFFAIGRSWFGFEKYAQAQQAYLRGAAQTRDPKRKIEFLWHAARSAQLRGDDAGAETLMTAAIAIPIRTPATAAALTQRMRTRLHGRRVAAAAADFRAVRTFFPKDHAVVEVSLAWSLVMIANGNDGAALSALNSIPRNLMDKFDVPEIDYWRARALETSNPHAAFEAYLAVLRATVPTHFAYFARDRLDAPAMQPKLNQELAARDTAVIQAIAAKNFQAAKKLETDRILLSSRNRPQELQRLAAIYRQIPAYNEVLSLQPEEFPRFPLRTNDRPSLLMAMGLFDEAIDAIPRRYPLRPLRSAVTQSLALNRGSASRESIYAIEVAMNGVPDDYHPDLLPLAVRQLLYPRYFIDFIDADSKKYGADPTLVLSIMREESRFNPRAKSEAAARGLLQFIITTARDIGRNIGLVNVTADDLYDPAVIIHLGAKYISELLTRFGGDHYMAAGAYNAGPKQVAQWGRFAAGPGDDFFLSSVTFDETKNYVRKVMNSYKRYVEIYGNGAPAGGIRAEP